MILSLALSDMLVFYRGEVMKKNRVIIKIFFGMLLLFCVFGVLLNVKMCFSEIENDCFKLCPWQVGQFVEYQIISLEDLGQENRYRISIVGKEYAENSDYFWIILDVFSGNKREISFKALVEPLDSIKFAERPDLYISEGMLFLLRNARRLIIVMDDNSSHEISAAEFFNASDVLKDSLYKYMPAAKNQIDYTKMKFRKAMEMVPVPAGIFDCYHFSVSTTAHDSYTDEGFDLWRSPSVPFLGIVKMEFSKSEYLKKWNHRYSQQMSAGSWLSKLYTHFFLRRVPAERKDNYTLKLADYGQN